MNYLWIYTWQWNSQFHKFIVINAEICYNLELWKFDIYNDIILCPLKTLILHIESNEKNFQSAWPRLWVIYITKENSVDRPVHHVSILHQLSSGCCRYTTPCSPDGSSKPRATELGFKNRHLLYSFHLYFFVCYFVCL